MKSDINGPKKSEYDTSFMIKYVMEVGEDEFSIWNESSHAVH